MKAFSFVFLLLICWQILPGQNRYSLELLPLDQDAKWLEDKLKFKNTFEDPLDVQDQLRNILFQLYDKAYLAASIDSLVRRDSIYRAYLFTGERYEWASLTNGNVEEALLDQVGFREKLYSGKDFHYSELRKLLQKILSYAENHGYPFASVGLGDINVEDNRIYAKIYLRKNRLITIDKIENQGEAKISTNYLAAYLELKKGNLYNEAKILDIRKRISETAFLKESRPVNITFIEDKATVNVFLENKKASRFDFLIGFLPRSQETGKLILTGQAQIDLRNPFGTGKTIRLEWQQLRPGTQELDVQFLYPYVAGLPFGFDFTFNLYKRDSSYLDLDRDIGVQYHLNGSDFIKAYWNNRRSTTLTVNTQQILNNRTLPSNLDVSHSTFGLEYFTEKLDYRFNPKKGYDLRIRSGAGVKKINMNNKILSLTDPDDPSFDFGSLYDSLDLQTFQFSIRASFGWYFPLSQRSVLKAGLKSGILSSGEENFSNELFRIGGSKILRGFDEESVFASFYSIFTGEYRFIIGQNSYFYVFTDYGYVRNDNREGKTDDRPLGFGAGMTFETKAGIFGINYALGKQSGAPLDFRSAKIHFGYVNFF